LPNGLDARLSGSMLERGQARAALGVPPDAFCFGTIGRLVAKKDHATLLSGFAYLKKRTTANTILIVMGGGELEAELVALAARLGIEQDVVFTGNLDAAYRYLPALDTFVFSSGVREAFGIVLLEAMMARLPVVCSNAPGPVEVVGDTARLFEAGNAEDLGQTLLAVLALSDSERSALAEACADRFARAYTLDAVSQKLWQLPQLRAAPGLP
jgi:hypothetical protein